MKIINGNVTTPKGFSASGVHSGLKKLKKDMAVIKSEKLCRAAGCFTTNIVKAAPVIYDMKTVKNPVLGVVINSGNANACTGEQGLRDAEKTAEIMAELCGCKGENILVASTGVIGVNMPMDIIEAGVKACYKGLGSDFESGEDAAEAIMTTDTFKKSVCVQIEIGGKTVTLAGMAKGSGMINPNMATMLCFITTDADISSEVLQKALSAAVIDSFNMISVDGDMSTNDTVVVLANGMAENPEIKEDTEEYNKFFEALFHINKTLAVKCAADGEGATKLIETHVYNAKTKKDARIMARSVVSSNLFKAAIFGSDANWGRALCAMGYSGADFEPDKVSLTFVSENGSIDVMKKGKPVVFDEDIAKRVLTAEKIIVEIDADCGQFEATAWGCDLTYDYVKINGDYRS
ncbi:MAG: bifunctional ornithine acetyltransferase/N-acetylglutamate synthase [Clostridiales bacterium]|nr:bifunctional ornithine acetyltransferase/N-acetylglutamate synthase [Clostridiales bacterium]